MKKIFLLILIPFLYLSCSKEAETEDVAFQLLPISEVELPATFNVNKDNNIKIKFVRPTECHAFNKFYSEKNGTIRTIAVESVVFQYSNGGCAALQNNNVATQILKFNPSQSGEYTLKFWNGKDSNGVDLFLTYTVIVE
jgi:hypothetical protein